MSGLSGFYKCRRYACCKECWAKITGSRKAAEERRRAIQQRLVLFYHVLLQPKSILHRSFTLRAFWETRRSGGRQRLRGTSGPIHSNTHQTPPGHERVNGFWQQKGRK
uniref:Uncharacterized protein n=1 Tax=Astyanax mexicanus TaxID=7994 RepID=A0A3B1JX54_ASTMX